MANLCLTLILALSMLLHVDAQGRGAIRLVRNNYYSSTYTSGIVEIYYGSTWGNICDDSYFDSTEADVICHQLAYTGAFSYGYTGSYSGYGTDTSSTVLEDVSCTSSSYLVLLQCRTSFHYSSYCSSDSRDVYVICYTTRIWNSPYTGQIRLMDGAYSNRGRLEIYCNGQWGTVCDDFWGSSDAEVACNQLGYSSYSRNLYSSTIVGSSSQPIWLDDVSCFSSYSCLTTCSQCPSSQYHNCDHSEDVTIECETSSSSSTITTMSTCQFISTITTSSSAVIGGIVGGVIFFLICCGLVIGIPICVCCCVGVGAGAAAGRSGRRGRGVTTTAAAPSTVAVVTQQGQTNTLKQDAPPAYNPGYDSGYIQKQSYPSDQPSGYPPSGYTYPPQQPTGYAYPPDPAQQYPPPPY